MCFPTFTALGSLFLLFSFLLELFIMIGQLSNRQFLNKIYYASAWNNQQNLSYNLGLWNYCTGDGHGGVSSCAHPTAAYNWAKTPHIVDIVPNMATSWMAKGLFLGLFILVFIALGFSFIFWLMSLPICCLKKRAWGYSMSTLVFINFMIMLVALILALVLVLAGIKQLTGADNTWNAHAGNALWLTIGAVFSLFFSFLFYSGGVCGKKKKSAYDNNYNDGTSRSGCCGIGRKRNKAQVDPNYKSNTGYDNTVLPGTNQPMYAASPNFQHTPAQNSTMLQQPYRVSPSPGHQQLSPSPGHQQLSPSPGHQQLSPGISHTNVTNNATNNATGSGVDDPNSVSVPMHGYQTPVLQTSNLPH